jgi:hypothetical protein
LLHAFHGTLDIDKVGMSETSWLSSSSINRNSDVSYVSDAFEQVIQISIGHLKGHVPYEKESRRRVQRFAGAFSSLTLNGFRLICGVLD